MDAQSVMNDPEFHALPPAEQAKVLREVDPEFAGLPASEQKKVILSLPSVVADRENNRNDLVGDPRANKGDGIVVGTFGGAARAVKPVDENGFSIGETIKNIPASAGKMVSDIATAVAHPIDTVSAVGNLAEGATVGKLLDHMGLPDQAQEHNVGAANAAWGAMVDRYGSVDNLLNTIQTDPVGFAADVSTVLGGAGAAAKGVGAVSGVSKIADAGKALSTAGKMADPVNIASKAVSVPLAAAADKVAPLVHQALGATTGMGPEGVRRAAEGGKDFVDTMRGKNDARSIVDEFKGAVQQVKDKRNAQYQQDLQAVFANPQPINFGHVESAFDQKLSDWGVKKTINSNGETVLDKTGSKISEASLAELKKISDMMDEWRNNPQLHNAESLNNLKVRLANEYVENSQIKSLTTGLKHNIDKTISDAAPGYKEMNAKYEDTMNQLQEIHSDLASVKDKASLNTTLNKLRSTSREGFELRRDVLKDLEETTGVNLGSKVAGYDAQNWMPKGLIGKMAQMGTASSAATGAYMGHPASLLAAAPIMALSSPRVVGEAFNAINTAKGLYDRAGSYLDYVGRDNISLLRDLAMQAGRTEKMKEGR